VKKKPAQSAHVKYWEIIADNLKKAGWSLGWVSAVDSQGRTIWIVDAHRDDGKRYVVRGGDSELNLASPLCQEGQHGGSIGSEGCESQVGMKRGKERCDRSLTVSYGIGCQLN
jgi:hypothetical protein